MRCHRAAATAARAALAAPRQRLARLASTGAQHSPAILELALSGRMSDAAAAAAAGGPTGGPVIIDGNATAAAIRGELRGRIERLAGAAGRQPGLAVLLVGSRTDSATYVRMKRKACAEVGIDDLGRDLPADASEAEVLAAVRELNADPRVDGILVQLPLPAHINEAAVLDAISQGKDADGLHPFNMGCLVQKGRTPAAYPCTPWVRALRVRSLAGCWGRVRARGRQGGHRAQCDALSCRKLTRRLVGCPPPPHFPSSDPCATLQGCVELLKRYNIPIAGKHAVVLGRSNIVGVPASQLLLQVRSEGARHGGRAKLACACDASRSHGAPTTRKARPSPLPPRPSPSAGERDGDDLPQPHARRGGRHPGRRHRGRGHWARQLRAGRVAQAGRGGHRRGH